MLRTLPILVLLLMAQPAAAQQQADPGIMAVLLGQCIYRDAVAQGEVQQARQQLKELAAYWAAWIAATEQKVGEK